MPGTGFEQMQQAIRPRDGRLAIERCAVRRDQFSPTSGALNQLSQVTDPYSQPSAAYGTVTAEVSGDLGAWRGLPMVGSQIGILGQNWRHRRVRELWSYESREKIEVIPSCTRPASRGRFHQGSQHVVLHELFDSTRTGCRFLAQRYLQRQPARGRIRCLNSRATDVKKIDLATASDLFPHHGRKAAFTRIGRDMDAHNDYLVIPFPFQPTTGIRRT